MRTRLRTPHRAKAVVAVWLLLAAAAQADTAVAGSGNVPKTIPATTPETPWPATAARAAGADEPRLAAAGWACRQVLDLPSATHPLLALCRRSATSAAGELHLVLLPKAEGTAPQVLTRLGDASKADLRSFAPAAPCATGVACLAGVVLVDQRDEGLCYGTQVVVVPVDKPARSLGFINEWSQAQAESTCIGGLARVSGMGGTGTGNSVVIDLPGPLARTGPDGNPRPVAARSVRYRIAAERPALKRQVIGP